MDDEATTGQSLPVAALREMLKSQFHAALAMLRDAVEKCPAELWDDGRYTNRCWQVAYHALFFVHYYLQPTSEGFEPWMGHRTASQHPDSIPGPPDPASDLPLIPEMFTRDEVLAYWQVCEGLVDELVDAIDLTSDASGFSWYPIPKLEHVLVNLRHVQHHAAQIADRVRTHADVGVNWAGARRNRATSN
jgi:hypothetical protein